jgi:hypothetical protein
VYGPDKRLSLHYLTFACFMLASLTRTFPQGE